MVMHTGHFDGSFAGWRSEARRLLQASIAPHAVTWAISDANATSDLFHDTPAPASTAPASRSIPRQLLSQLETAARFRTDDRWGLLYRILWRVSHGDRSAMLAGDVDGLQLHRRIKAVHREVHHMHAFLRFRGLPEPADSAAFIAWYEPAHDILDMAVEHFAQRMGGSTWLIATPDSAACWDGTEIRITRPCPAALAELARAAAETDDSLWLAYYRSTFNPARLNKECLERHLPVRFWKHLAEGAEIPRLMSDARVGGQVHGQAAALANRQGHVIGSITRHPCQNCPKRLKAKPPATEGFAIVLLADQPGAHPFGGASGRYLDQAMRDAGLDRGQVHLTCAIKHFNPLVEIKARARRQLLMPSPEEITNCRPCLQVELDRVRPKVILALGQTATQALMGEDKDFSKLYGHLVEDNAGRRVLIGDHPSELLWNHPIHRQCAYDTLVLILRQAKRLSGGGS
jgi:DNA polymerase